MPAAVIEGTTVGNHEIFSFSVNKINNANQPKVHCKINGIEIKVIIDTGSFLSILHKKMAERLGLKYEKVDQSKIPNLQGVSGTKLHINGTTGPVEIELNGKVFHESFVVISNVQEGTIILGLQFLRKNKLTLSFVTPDLESSNCSKNLSLKSRILVEGDYKIKPFSTEIVFAKIDEVFTDETDEIVNEVQCCDMDLSLKNQFQETVIYQVLNRSDFLIELKDQDILALTITDGKPTTTCIQETTGTAMTAERRAKTAFDHLQIKSNPDMTEAQKQQVEALLLENHSVFAMEENDIGCIQNYKHEINIKDEFELRKGNRNYPIPLKLVTAAKCELARLEKLKIIERCVTKYAVPSFFVKKKSGSVRLINDFRHTNTFVTAEVTCIAPLEVLLSSIDKTNVIYMCFVDVADAFYSMVLHENSRDYCSFTFPNLGSWKFLRVPLGLKNSPSSMSYVVQRLLGDIPNCLTYVDDILIFDKTIDKLIQSVKMILEKLRVNGFKINYKKMVFGKKSCEFLGFNISQEGVRPIHDKLNAIRLMPAPSTRRGCQAVIGSMVYYSRFIKNFSDKIRPLIECIKQKADQQPGVRAKNFKLTDEAKQAFEKLKLDLMKAPILRLADAHKKFYIFSDASQFAVGAVLTQEENGTFFPIAYYSRSLTPGQRNYCAFLRELLAIIGSIKHFKYYIEGATFEVKTDSLTLTRPKFLTKTQIRCALFWILEITSRYNFTISWIKGSENNMADSLSRIDSKDLPPLSSKGWYKWFEDTFQSQLNEQVSLITAENREVSQNTGTEADPVDQILDSNGYFLKEQLEDEHLAYMRSALETKESELDLPQRLYSYKQYWPFITLSKANLICIKWYEKSCEKFYLKIIAPYKTQEKILHDAHCHPTAGHFGAEKTLTTVRALFWWPNMNKIIRAYCGACAVCHEINTRSRPKPKAELKFWDDYGNAPGSIISIDVFATARHSVSNKYILVIIDKFSRYLEFTVMQNSRAPTIARVLVKYMMQNGIPNLLLSDLGQELQGKIVSNVLNVLKITRLRTAPFSPGCNGASERSFRTIRQLLTKFVSEQPNTYQEILPMLTYSINTAENSTTKVSPFFLQRGYHPRPLTGIYWGITSTEFYRSQQHCQSELYKKTKIAYEFAMRNMRNTEFSVSEAWNQKVKYIKFFPGQNIYYFSPVGNISHRKIRSPFQKAVIIKSYKTDVYLIKILSTGRTLISSYRRLTLIPHHITKSPQITKEDEEDEPNIDLSSGGELESDSDRSSTASSEDFESAEDSTPERPLPRRSSRTSKPVEKYQATW